jgi:hypothetical protein
MPTERSWLVACCLLGCAHVAEAQLLTTYFPEGVPGYGAGQGVTVRSRARPALEPLGIRAGNVTIRPRLDVSLGYDNNIFGSPVRRGAWEIANQPSVLLSSELAGGGIGLFASAQDVRYFGEPSQNRTDGTAFLGGTINLGRDKLTLGGGYLARHEDRSALDALPTERPVAFTVANLRSSYAAEFGRFTLTPSFELNRWRFANATIAGVPVSQSPRDRTTAQLAVTLRHAWMPGRDMLLVTRVLDTRYDHPAVAIASKNSSSVQLLGGVEYDADTVWRYRLLAGLQYRDATAVAAETTGIAEAEIIWSPSGLTTVHASVVRGIEDAAQTGLSSYTYTSAQVTLDHEVTRDILLNASAGTRLATFSHTGGQQVGAAFGAGATWLMNRAVRLGLTYDFTDVRNARLPAGTVAGNYSRSLTLLTMRLSL